MVRPRSCRVIYYFDTPALGRRHQSFGRVNLFKMNVMIIIAKNENKKNNVTSYLLESCDV